MRLKRCWNRYQYLVYPMSCWILMAAVAFAIYGVASRSRRAPHRPETVTMKENVHSMVLVVAYMRSGSSFLGDILQQHEPSFYVYEPLKEAVDRIDNNKTIVFFNGTERYIQTPEEKISFFVETLYNWFTCNFNDLDLSTLTSSYLLYYSKKTRTYYMCLKRHDYSQDGVVNCLRHLEATCVPAELRTIKSIRINMDTVHLLHQRLPSLKVIHVIRDPRGIMNSRFKVKLSNWINLETEVSALCKRMARNKEIATIMNEENVYIKEVVYELLAEHPIGISEDIYKFAGLEFSPAVLKRVFKMTHYSPLARDCDWCTKRSNSTSTSLRWRTQLDLAHALVIDSQCVHLYNAIGYLPVHDLYHLRNLNMPLRRFILRSGPL
ncbi:carbohydrate sulfotransferase 5-like [Argopecten irradians]|uniref:carbohydrate sulfotransferase 5-like n=1 Tax=Argopecten irradians TaxID=31199 RepID=UPI00371EA26E